MNFGAWSIYSYPSILAKLTGMRVGVEGRPAMFLRDMRPKGRTILWGGSNDLMVRDPDDVLEDVKRLASPEITFLNIIWRKDCDDIKRRYFNSELQSFQSIDIASVVRPEHYHWDGAHLNHKGNRAIAAKVSSAIRPLALIPSFEQPHLTQEHQERQP
jgi:hypothetical protein